MIDININNKDRSVRQTILSPNFIEMRTQTLKLKLGDK